MKLTYQNTGINVAVGIEGSKSEIEGQYFSFLNHGAIGPTAKLEWLNSGMAFVWTTDEKLKKYFKNSSYHIVMNELGEDFVGSATSGPIVSKRIKSLAESRFNELIENRDVIVRYKKSGDFYEIGTMNAENLSDTDA